MMVQLEHNINRFSDIHTQFNWTTPSESKAEIAYQFFQYLVLVERTLLDWPKDPRAKREAS